MSKLNESALAIKSALGNAIISDKNVVSVENESAIKDAMLNTGVSEEQLESLSSIVADSSAALTSLVGESMMNHLKANEDVNNLSFGLTAPLASFGIDIARPEGEVTRQIVRDNIGSRVVFRGLDSTSDVADELAAIWDI